MPRPPKKETKKSRGITTIQIAEETRDALKRRGRKGETYDDIIKKLLER
jgi:hypothetical protein